MWLRMRRILNTFNDNELDQLLYLRALAAVCVVLSNDMDLVQDEGAG